jgi:hypothetical protein
MCVPAHQSGVCVGEDGALWTEWRAGTTGVPWRSDQGGDGRGASKVRRRCSRKGLPPPSLLKAHARCAVLVTAARGRDDGVMRRRTAARLRQAAACGHHQPRPRAHRRTRPREARPRTRLHVYVTASRLCVALAGGMVQRMCLRAARPRTRTKRGRTQTDAETWQDGGRVDGGGAAGHVHLRGQTGPGPVRGRLQGRGAVRVVSEPYPTPAA